MRCAYKGNTPPRVGACRFSNRSNTHSRLAQSRKKGKNGASNACDEDKSCVSAMSAVFQSGKSLLRAVPFLILIFVLALLGQDKPADTNAKADSLRKDVKLTIVVTGGEDKMPIDSASVYVRYVEEHKHGKDKKIEMNLKTNRSGVCHVPVIPPGKFIVQVIAEGWKTYGEYYDVNQTEQTINITLVRPPKWY